MFERAEAPVSPKEILGNRFDMDEGCTTEVNMWVIEKTTIVSICSIGAFIIAAFAAAFYFTYQQHVELVRSQREACYTAQARVHLQNTYLSDISAIEHRFVKLTNPSFVQALDSEFAWYKKEMTRINRSNCAEIN